MGFRDAINKNQPLVFTTVVFVIALAAFVVFRQVTDTAPKPPRTFFTTDDGATWFPDDVTKVAPVTINGKEAVYARLYQCADGKPRISYLEKLVPEFKKAMDEANAARKAGQPVDYDKLEAFAGPWSRMYKRPGDKEWVKGTQADAILASVKCEDGSTPQNVQ